jgi:hypothetical protein
MIVTLMKSRTRTPVSRDFISPRHVGGSSELDPKTLAQVFTVFSVSVPI